jgi:hypothetical protein
MVVKVLDVLDTGLLNEAWELYREAFEDLNEVTIQRHLDTEEEFRQIASDRRIQKYLSFADDGTLRGVSCYTPMLGVGATPLISTAYFARRYPEQFSRGRVYVCLFVAVHKQHRGRTGAFVEMVDAMYREAWDHKGVIVLDVCRFNIEAHHLDRGIIQVMHGIDPDVYSEDADAQHYLVYVPGGRA